jgi:hypothetical protein
MGELICSQECLQSIACLPFSHSLNNKDKKNNRNEQKNKKKPTLDLAYTLVFQTMSSPLSSFFWSKPRLSFQKNAM